MPDILKTFPVLSRPPHPHPKSPHHNWICLHFNIATATDETKSKWNCVFLIFSTQNITSHTSHHISISKSCSPKSVLKCVETFSLLFVCPHFFRIFGPIRPARGRASTHIFECRKTYRGKNFLSLEIFTESQNCLLSWRIRETIL